MQKFLSLPLIGLAATAFACDQQATVTNLDVGPLFAIWEHAVNGGGELTNPNDLTIFMQVSVKDFGDGREVSGQVERYSMNPDGTTHEKWHGEVDAFLIGTHQRDGNTVVNICGDIRVVQEEGTRSLGPRFGIQIKDVPDGPDLIAFPPSGRVTCEEGNLQGDCDECGENFFGWMVDGDFRVR